jgi:preprotein translocase subunit SecY
MRQVETHLIQRHYDGFLRKGKIRGRNDRVQGASGRAADTTTVVWLWVGIAIVTLGGVVYFLLKKG